MRRQTQVLALVSSSWFWNLDFRLTALVKSFKCSDKASGNSFLGNYLSLCLPICSLLIQFNICKPIGKNRGIVALTAFICFLEYIICIFQEPHGIFQYPKWFLLFSQTVIKEVLSFSFPWLDFKFRGSPAHAFDKERCKVKSIWYQNWNESLA